MVRYSRRTNRLHLSTLRKRPGPKKGYWKNRLAARRQSQPEADANYVASRFTEYQREPYPTRNPSNTSATVKQEIVTVETPEHSDLTFSSLQNMLYESCPNLPSTTIKVEPSDDYPVLDQTLPLISDVRTDPYSSNNLRDTPSTSASVTLPFLSEVRRDPYSRNYLRDTPSTSASVTLPLISDVRTDPYSSNSLRDTPSTSAAVTLPFISDVRPVVRTDISTASASGTLDDLDTFIPSTVVDCQLGADDSPKTDDINSNGATSIDDESELCDKCGSYIRKLDPVTGLPKTNPKNVPVGGCHSSDCGEAGCNKPGCFRSMNNVMNHGGVVVMETPTGKDGASEAYMVEIGIDTNLQKMQTYAQMTALRLNRLKPKTCLLVQNAIEELLFNAEDGQYDLLDTHKGLVKKAPVENSRYLKQIGVMAGRKRMLDMKNPRDPEIIRNMLLNDSDDSDAVVDEEDSDAVVDESDTDEEEHVSPREGDSESEMSAESSSDEDDGNISFPSEAYVAYQKKDKKIIDSWTWYKEPLNETERPPYNIYPYIPEVIGPAKNLTDVLDIWECFFTNDIIRGIVEDTNKYVSHVKSNYSPLRDTKETDVSELKALLGLLYSAGVYRGNRVDLEELWKMDDFKGVMSLRRFSFLLRALRFDDINTRAERKKVDRLAPIRNIFENFISNCQKCYSLGENVTIDEKFEKFWGRCSFIQYIPKKPNQYGVKIYAMVDARMFYTYNMEIYAGAQPDGPFSLSNKPQDVVKRLTTPIYNTGRNVTVDNWFSSFDLVQDLAEKKLSLVGTLKKNKAQIPDEFKLTKKRETNTSLFGFRKDMTLLSYVPKRNKNVILISSLHDDKAIDEATGDQKNPEIMTFYNLTKGGVDTVDKLCASYDVARNTRRWPLVVFFSMLNVAAINSYIIHATNNEEKRPRRTYLRQLANSLVKEYVERKAPAFLGSELKLKVLKRKAELGVEEVTQATSEKKRCKPCQNDKRTRITRFSCEICQKFICVEHSKPICPDCNAAMK